jgi:hypothetical protein
MKPSAKIISYVIALGVTTATHRRRRQPNNTKLQPHNRPSPNHKRTLTRRRKARLLVLQSEPLLGTPLEAQSSELGIPVARRGGQIGRPSEEWPRAVAVCVGGPA